jgi:hypothetical protein
VSERLLFNSAIFIFDIHRFTFEWKVAFYLAHLAKGNVSEDIKKSSNQKQELPVEAMFVNGSGQNEHSL